MTRRSSGIVLGALAVAVASCGAPSKDGGSTVSGLVDIGGGRCVFMECRGVGSPTVVLISGKGVGAEDWLQVLDPADPAHEAPGDDVGAGLGNLHRSDDAVFPSVARFTRVCAYDRPDTRVEGTDLSTPRQQPHTVDLDVTDLQELLTAVREPEPYVLVPHSYGGLIATLYTRTHPMAVGGLVMVDAATELIEDVISPAKLANWDQMNRATSAQVREGVELIDAFRQINAAPPMPKVPAIVLTADKPYRTDLLPPEATEGDKLVSFADWLASQERLASALGAEHMTQTKSGHHIYLYSPALVIDAIRQVECRSAIERLAREGALKPAARRRSLTAIDRLVAAFDIVTFSPEVEAHTLALLGRHALRPLDALQLGCAQGLALRGDTDALPEFACCDRRLATAAAAAGFSLLFRP